MGQHHSRGGIHRIEIGVEAARFGRGVVWLQIVCPAVADGLIPKLRLNLKWSLRIAQRNGIQDAISGAGKVWIISGFAVNGDFFIGSLFIEAVGQQPVVFQISDRPITGQ